MNRATCKQCSRETPVEYIRDRSCVHCEGDRNRQDVDRMRDLIRELKSGPGEDRKRDVIRDITAIGHPDVPSMLKAIEEKASAPAPRRRAS